MPEGDTVWLAGQRLHAALSGRVLIRSDFRVPRLAVADVAGDTVTEVVSRGKHLLFRLASGRTLHSHFRMDGSWHLYAAGRPWTGGKAHEVRAVLETDVVAAVGYRLHDLDLVPTSAEADLVGHLGPDLLGPDWDLTQALRRLATRSDREIGPALLDQRNLAGIGNLYKSEALFLRGVTPWASVADTELEPLVRLARKLLVANRSHWEQTTTGNLRRGEHHWVFERARRPCLRCGTAIRVETQTEPDQPGYGRLSYWCPHCQDGPAPP